MTLKRVCMTCDATWLVGDKESHRLDCLHHSRRALGSVIPAALPWTFAACRDRDSTLREKLSALGGKPVPLTLPHEYAELVVDRSYLINLVSRMRDIIVLNREYIDHAPTDERGCAWGCSCGLDEHAADVQLLLSEVEQREGGGR